LTGFWEEVYNSRQRATVAHTLAGRASGTDAKKFACSAVAGGTPLLLTLPVDKPANSRIQRQIGMQNRMKDAAFPPEVARMTP
jgi:hypothetical protein